MKTIHLTESKWCTVKLTTAQAEELRKVGKRLASDRRWWGEDEDAEKTERSIIRCEEKSGGDWRVRVYDAVGLVAVKDLNLVVQPKIPINHLLYLFAASERFPRIDEARAHGDISGDIWSLIAEWFVRSVEYVLRNDLIRDYAPANDWLQTKRGRIDPVSTARAYYRGRLAIKCDYEEFSQNTPLNRILKQASLMVVRSPKLPQLTRKRALAALARMEAVGEYRHDDLRASIDRRCTHYRDAIPLARHLLRWQGASIASANTSAWAFLIRTPEMVEEGLRKLLQMELGGEVSIEKTGVCLEGSKLTLNPDLVFDNGNAIGDVKYKLSGKDWQRSDLNQIVTFATGFYSRCAAVFGFCSRKDAIPPPVQVGNISVQYIAWQADENLPPKTAMMQCAEETTKWLKTLSPVS